MARTKKNEVTPATTEKRVPHNKPFEQTMYNFQPGDNSRNIAFSMAVAKLPKIDLFDPDQVEKRTWEYFSMCEQADMRPLVTGYASALGLDRRRLYEIRTGNFHNNYNTWKDLPQESLNMIHQAYDFLEQLWEANMVQGKVNPVTGIFLGKNNWGYKDNVDYTITPNAPQTDRDEIIRRYEIEHSDDES